MPSHRPAPVLAPYATRIVGYEELDGQPVARREIPSGGFTLIVSFGPSMRITSPGASSPSRLRSFVAGLHDAPAGTEHDGTQAGVQIDLTPLGACALLGSGLDELTNAVVPLDAVLGAAGRRIEERLSEASGWTERRDLVEGILSAAALHGGRPSPEVLWLWSQLEQSGGTIPVAELAEEVGWSRRHLTARFHREIGLPPKGYARVVRMRRAARLLSRVPALSLGEVALECGYYDQAHFSREFRALAGCTPGRFAAEAAA